MVDPVNLNKARKAREKAKAEQTARENRAKFGRTGLQKKSDAALAAKTEADLTRKRLDRDDPQRDG